MPKLPFNPRAADKTMGAALMLVIIFLPNLYWLARQTAKDEGVWPLWIPIGLGLGLFVFIAAAVYRARGRKLTTATWEFAFSFAAKVECLWGAFVLVTGRTMNKLNSVAVPRSSAIVNFSLAALWWIVALLIAASARSSAPGDEGVEPPPAERLD